MIRKKFLINAYFGQKISNIFKSTKSVLIYLRKPRLLALMAPNLKIRAQSANCLELVCF